MKNAWFSKKHFALTRAFAENAGVAVVLNAAGKPVAATLIQETPPSGGQDDFQLVASTKSGFDYLMLADGHVTAKGKAFAKNNNIDATPQGLLTVVENRDDLAQAPEKSSVQHKYAADVATPLPGDKYTRDWGFR